MIIVPINEGDLEVWWHNRDKEGVAWPSLVRQYKAVWPDDPIEGEEFFYRWIQDVDGENVVVTIPILGKNLVSD